jgi:DNA-binding NarL/FixJ family response regulator
MASFDYKVEILNTINSYRLSQKKLATINDLALGFSNQAIAQGLGVSTKTIERILSELNKKLSRSNDYKNFHDLFNPRIRLLVSLVSLDLIEFYTESELRFISNLDKKLNQTLILMTIGFSNKQIAKILDINEKTVELRLTQLFDYFNIDTKNQSFENPRVSLFISAYCRLHLVKPQLKRLYKETLAGRIELNFLETESFINTLEDQHKIIG